MFSGDDLAISKIIAIGNTLNLSFQEIINSSLTNQKQSFSFTEAQEEYLAEHIHLYYFLNLLGNHEGEELQELAGLDAKQIYRYLRSLEKIDLLELHPNNKYRLKYYWPITWLKGGPLQKSLMMTRHKEYIEHLTNNLQKEHSHISSGEGVMSKESFKLMQDDYKRLFEKYAAIRMRDQQTTPKENLIEHIWLHGAGEFHRDIDELLKEK